MYHHTQEKWTQQPYLPTNAEWVLKKHAQWCPPHNGRRNHTDNPRDTKNKVRNLFWGIKEIITQQDTIFKATRAEQKD